MLLMVGGDVDASCGNPVIAVMVVGTAFVVVELRTQLLLLLQLLFLQLKLLLFLLFHNRLL